MSLFSIDGHTYPGVHVISLKRNFQVLDGPNADRVQDGSMVRDIIGTFYNYSMELDASEASLTTYDALYELITAPDDSHALVVPYAQGSLSFDAYVATGSDELIDATGGRYRWGSLSFNFIATKPQRVPA